MKRVLAISGGVDSMVLLDFCAKKFPKNELIVAHFDHGTRPSSKDDFDFVKKAAEKYNVEFVGKHAKLGARVSEEKAREERYRFLFGVVSENSGILLTAHHLDDLVESVVINFLRGTGVRGLAVMNNSSTERPFLSWTKKDILKYAADNEIIFREDPTNSSDDYLRNRIRFSVRNLNFETKQEILALRNEQVEVLRKIHDEVDKILKENMKKLENETYQVSRGLFDIDDKVAIEILRELLSRKNISCTRPQLVNFLAAIQEYQPGKKFNLPHDKLVKIHKNYFVL